MGRLVYSTDQGKICPDCSQPVIDCECRSNAKNSVPEGDGIVRIQRETKGRKGKGVTIISGLPLAESDLKKLAKELKQRCSTGGSIRDGKIEIQGDQRNLLKQLLQDKGFQVKLSGG